MSVRRQLDNKITRIILKKRDTPDCLLGVVPQPTDSRLSEAKTNFDEHNIPTMHCGGNSLAIMNKVHRACTTGAYWGLSETNWGLDTRIIF